MQSRRTLQSELLGSKRCGLGGDITGADLTLRLHDLCIVDELFKVSYWAPGAKALVAI